MATIPQTNIGVEPVPETKYNNKNANVEFVP